MQFQSHQPAVAKVDMTPMIDIVFQLIAFFMVITNFEQTQADERVKLPRDQLAKPVEVKRANELTLNIGFRRDDEGNEISGPTVFYAGEFVPVAKLGPVLQRERRLYVDVGTDPKDVTVVIRADAKVPTGLIQDIIRLAQEAEFEKFAVRATQMVQQ